MADQADDARDVADRRGDDVRAAVSPDSRLRGVRLSASHHQCQWTALRDTAQDARSVS